jgi:hypothetical protein
VRGDRIRVGGGWQEKVYNREEWKAADNGKELLHSVHANGMNEYFNI